MRIEAGERADGVYGPAAAKSGHGLQFGVGARRVQGFLGITQAVDGQFQCNEFHARMMPRACPPSPARAGDAPVARDAGPSVSAGRAVASPENPQDSNAGAPPSSTPSGATRAVR